ncbi:MAG: hypothetical protein ACKE9I_02465 [Methylophagaceae bacterium]
MDIEIKSLKQWSELNIVIVESHPPPVLTQTYLEWLQQYPDGYICNNE